MARRGGGLDLRVSGADDLARLGRDLQAAGDKHLKREVLKAAQRATRPVKPEIKEAARRELPSSGGLNQWVASAMKVTTKTRTMGRNVGVRIVMKRPNPNNRRGLADLNAINRGRVRHLTWGHLPAHIQIIRGGFVDRVMDGVLAHRARREFLAAIDQIKAQLRRAA